jgi:hypothetical protein
VWGEGASTRGGIVKGEGKCEKCEGRGKLGVGEEGKRKSRWKSKRRKWKEESGRRGEHILR